MSKTILAAILGAIFLISVPVRAEEKAPPAGEEKAAKAPHDKKAHKDKKDDGKKEEKGSSW